MIALFLNGPDADGPRHRKADPKYLNTAPTSSHTRIKPVHPVLRVKVNQINVKLADVRRWALYRRLGCAAVDTFWVVRMKCYRHGLSILDAF